MHRVVVTGQGIISPIGHNTSEVEAALRVGKSGIRRMPEWDHVSDLMTRVGGPVDGIDLEAHYPRRKRRTMGKLGLFAMFASDQAIEQAGLTPEILGNGRCGLAYGSTSGSSKALEDFCYPLFTKHTLRGLESSGYLKFMTHTCAANLASIYGIRGRVLPVISACTSGSQSIGVAFENIQAGKQDVMLAGGAEELHYATASIFDLFMATSSRYNQTPTRTPRPFDKERDGLVIGEGAATLVLESLEHAQKRGAEILFEIVGFGTNCDGMHITAPSEVGMAGAMRLALSDSKLSPAQIDYVNAHGTGTDVGDVAEAAATYSVFERAIPISTMKGHTGHTLGACGAMELIFSSIMLKHNFLVQNLNFEVPDPRCAALDYIAANRSGRVDTIMSNNFAFGGVNTSIVIQRFDG